MQPSRFYEQMLAELQGEMSDLERRVFDALRVNPEGLTRQELIAVVYRGTGIALNLSNDRRDRKIRKAIQSLRGKGVPIISSSGRAGYKLDASPAGIQTMLNDLTSRRDRLNELIRRVQRMRSIPDAPPADPVQMKFPVN